MSPFFSDGSIIEYSKLCICSGVRPKLIAEHELVLGLRDLNSLEILTMKLSSARRVAIVGNGGISLELIHEVRNFWSSCLIVTVVSAVEEYQCGLDNQGQVHW